MRLASIIIFAALLMVLFLNSPVVGILTNSRAEGQNTNTINSVNSLSTTIVVIPQGASVTKNGQYYKPENVQIPINSRVTWTNKDSLPHTATASGNSFDTSIIQPGSSSSITFSSSKYASGTTIHYICTIHPWMTASLTLSPTSAGAPQTQSIPSATISSSISVGTLQQVMPVHSTIVKVLPKSSTTTLGTEPEHKNDWVTAEHDIFGTKDSNQTIIGKNNVNKLQVKWIIHSDYSIENPPLIIGDRGYLQDNALRVMAFDVNTGLNIWKFDPHSVAPSLASRGVSFSHGITYDNGVIFAGTGGNATIVAMNATDGKLIWQSVPVGDPKSGYGTVAAPTVWKDIVIEGQALGDNPPFPSVKGKLTAFNRTNGEKLWNLSTTIGSWVEGKNATINGGADPWSGGSLDPKTGIYYTSTGNPAPDYNDTTRPGPNLWSGSILAVDSKTGHIIWGTQVSKPNTKDYDAGFGISLATILTSSSNNTNSERVIVHGTKRGDAYALDAATGHIRWKLPVGVEYNQDAKVTAKGTGPVWPSSHGGVQYAIANDNKTAYFALENTGPVNYFPTHEDPIISAKGYGLGNGTVTAVDIKTGKIKWIYPMEFPSWTSPTVTNGLVFSGHITTMGKPYQFSEFGAPKDTSLNPSGIVFALDKNTGKKLWEFNVGAPVGVGGPSIGHGMLFVTTGAPRPVPGNKGGDVIAFGLPPSSAAENQTQSVGNATK